MRVVLEPRDPAVLASFIAAASTPGSASYGRYVARGAFAARFGPTGATIDAVRTALRRDHLDVTALSASHLVLSVTGSAASFARAMHTQVSVWRLAGGERGYRFDHAVRLPRTIARFVAGVAGTSSLVREHSTAERATGPTRATRTVRGSAAPRTCDAAAQAIANTSPGTFTPSQEGHAYGLDTAWSAGDDGTSRTIALLEFAPYAMSDVLAYDHCFSLIAPGATSDPKLRNVLVEGGTSPGSAAESAEPTLDIDQVRALAPGADVQVYLGPNNVNGPLDTLQRIATDDTAQVVSISWGICEAFSGHADETPVFEQMAAQGQTVFAAAGDSGSSDCLQQSLPGGPPLTRVAVDDPASQPLVTGVGGLTVARLQPLHQSVWNDCATSDQPGCLGGAGGGGISTVYPRPAWQEAPGAPSGPAPGAHARLVPDLSVMADPSTGMLAYLDGSFQAYGGTSMGAPLMAAVDAVAAQHCSASTFGFLNPRLYAMGRHGGDFVDVTQGTNEISYAADVANTYPAAVGYDMASGLGSPNPATFVDSLCNGTATASATPATASATASWSVSFHTGDVAYPLGGRVTVTAPPGTTLPSSTAAWTVNALAPSTVAVTSSHRSVSSNVATLTLAAGAPPVGLVTLHATGVTNPPAVGTASVEVTDSADALVTSATLVLAAGVPDAARSTVTSLQRTAALGSDGAAVRVTVRNAAGDAVAGARVTARASGRGVARFATKITDSSGTVSFVLRDDRAEISTVSVAAGSVHVGETSVRFTDPWSSHGLGIALRGTRFVGVPTVVAAPSSTTSYVAIERLATHRLFVAVPDGTRLASAVLPESVSMPLAASTPTLLRVGSTLYAAYRSTHGHLIVLRQGGGTHLTGWHGEDLTRAGAAPIVTGAPSIAVSGTGAARRLSIASISTRRDVVRTSALVSRQRNFASIDVSVAVGDLQSAAGNVAQVALGSTDALVVRTIYGQLEMFVPIAGSWTADDLAADALLNDTGRNAITSDPTAVVAPEGVVVAALTAAHRLDVFVGAPGNWSASAIVADAAGTSRPANDASLPGLVGTPSIAVRGAELVVLAATARGRLIELASLAIAAPWSSYDLTSLADTRGGGTAGIAILPGGRLELLGTFGGDLTQLTDAVG
jgi:hypothetical protein